MFAVMSIALVLPSVIGSLFEAAQSMISAIDECGVPSSLPIELSLCWKSGLYHQHTNQFLMN